MNGFIVYYLSYPNSIFLQHPKIFDSFMQYCNRKIPKVIPKNKNKRLVVMYKIKSMIKYKITYTFHLKNSWNIFFTYYIEKKYCFQLILNAYLYCHNGTAIILSKPVDLKTT